MNVSSSLLSCWCLFCMIFSLRVKSLQAFSPRTTTRTTTFSPSNFLSRLLMTPPVDQTDAAASSATTTNTTPTNPLASRGIPQPLILGSASFTRKLILKEMGVPYHIVVRPIDEKELGDRSRDAPPDLVLTLAKAKMAHLVQEIQAGRCHQELQQAFSSWQPSQQQQSQQLPEMIVLTGDQVVTCDGAILEKPESVDEAKAMVARYGIAPPSTVGSCVLTHLPSGVQVSGVDTATIHFQSTTTAADDLIDRLVAAGEPILSCAGGLMVEHEAVQEYITRIDGTVDSVMGLSKDLVLQLLDELAIKLKEQQE